MEKLFFMKKLLFMSAILINLAVFSQEVKKFDITTLETYSNGYVSESYPVEGIATLTLFDKSGTLVIQFTDGETKFTFTQYNYILNRLYISIPEAKFYNGGNYKFTGEILINLNGVIDLMNPKNGFKIIYR